MKLNLGCGDDIRKGWVNLDKYRLRGVDVVHDLNKLPLPFKNEQFDEILCQDIIEHFADYIPLIKELHRILKKGGTLHVRTPHFTSKYNFIDPTHRRLFSSRTFDFFLRKNPFGRSYYFDFCFEKITRRKITFEKRPYAYNSIAERLFNSSEATMGLYESTFLCRLLPALDVEIDIVK